MLQTLKGRSCQNAERDWQCTISYLSTNVSFVKTEVGAEVRHTWPLEAAIALPLHSHFLSLSLPLPLFPSPPRKQSIGFPSCHVSQTPHPAQPQQASTLHSDTTSPPHHLHPTTKVSKRKRKKKTFQALSWKWSGAVECCGEKSRPWFQRIRTETNQAFRRGGLLFALLLICVWGTLYYHM